jgi:hypothetical protein
MRLRDGWEDIWRSIGQLVFGVIIVTNARRQRLCTRHFADSDRARIPDP